MRGIFKLGVAALALAVVMAGPTRSEALVDDPYTSFTAPSNALVMPFDATDGWVSFMIVSNVAGVSSTAAGDILGVTTHWAYWSENCEHLVDVWVCLTLNDTIVVDPTNVSAIDVGNTEIGPKSDLSGHRGFVVVTAYETDEICSDGSIRGNVPVDNALVGSATRASTTDGYSFGNDAIGLGLEDGATKLPQGTTPNVDIQTLNPATDGIQSSVAMLSLREQSGSGDTADIEVGPNSRPKVANLVLYDNLEIPTSLPDLAVRCAAFASMTPGGGIIPDTISVDSSGFLRVLGINGTAGEFVYAVHGQAIGSYGASNYGKYAMTAQ